MPNVLIDSSEVLCDEEVVLPNGPVHGGSVSITSTAKLSVNGNPVLLKSGIVGKTVTGCKNNPPPIGDTPCLNVTSVTAGEATKLTVGGSGVMLDSTLAGTTSGVPSGLLKATAGQSKLTAI